MPIIDARTYTSPNHGPRTKPVSCLVIHHGAGTRKSDLATLTSATSKVSAHFYVCRDGTIYQMVPDDRVAWHAGTSILAGQTDVNQFSLGIETEHTTDPKAGPLHHDWPQPQLESLAWLCRLKMDDYAIPTSRVVSHRAIATPPGRKVDPSDPPLGPEPRFRQWADSLEMPVRSILPLHGMVLTNVSGRDRLEDKIVVGRHTVLKIIPSWGLDSAWTPERRAWACALTGHTLIRTHVGDPSAHKPYLHVDEVLAELTPWYAIRRHNLFIELGNEPNSDSGIDPSGYAWHLTKAISACRQAFPRAKIVSPALLLDRGNPARWLSNPDFAHACAQCDLLGVHVYAHVQFDDTGQLAQAQALYAASSQPRALTEYGIHDPQTPDATKGQRYAAFIATLPNQYQIATYYHTDDLATSGINAAYALDLRGDVAYGAALEAA